jgi:ribonuclease T1
LRNAAKHLLLLAAALFAAAAFARGDPQQLRDVRLQELPAEAHQTLQLIRSGGPFPHERDAPRGHYREYTVNTPGIKHRGARRIVVGCERQRAANTPAGPLRLAQCRGGGVFYYTADHYRSFRRIVE